MATVDEFSRSIDAKIRELRIYAVISDDRATNFNVAEVQAIREALPLHENRSQN